MSGESRRKIRLLLLISAFVEDAPNSITYATALGAQHSGDFDVLVAALAPGLPPPGAFPPEISLVDNIGHGSITSLLGARKLRKIINRFQPDILHASLTRPTLVGVPAARAAKVPVIVTTHHGSHEWHERGKLAALIVPKLYRMACQHTTRIICVSKKSSAEILALGVPGKRVTVIHNGVDQHRFSNARNTRTRDLLASLFPSDTPENILLVGAAGKFEWYKGHATLIRAMSRLLPEHPNVRCVIWGDGPLRANLHAQINAAGLDKHCLLAGHQQQMQHNLSACDVFVQPSLREAFGLAAAEAMSCGVPVLVSDAGGLPELVGHQNAHLIFPADDDLELAKRLTLLLTSAEKREQTGMAMRKRVEENFTITQTVAQHLQLYKKLYTQAVDPA